MEMIYQKSLEEVKARYQVLNPIPEDDFSGFVFGDFTVLFPTEVFCDLSFSSAIVWVCVDGGGRFFLEGNAPIKRLYRVARDDSSHFGVGFESSRSKELKLAKDSYINDWRNEFFNWSFNHSGPRLGKEEAAGRRKAASANFDLNMKFFGSLGKEGFEEALGDIVARYKFREISTLDGLSSRKGLYVIAFDGYRQFYVGKSKRLRERIIQHWVRVMPICRMLWVGNEQYSKLGVDSFRMLDTTRLFFLEDYGRIAYDYISAHGTAESLKRINLMESEADPKDKDLEIAEKVVISNCPCVYCLSERPPLMGWPEYNKISKSVGTDKSIITLLQFDDYYWPSRFPKA